MGTKAAINALQEWKFTLKPIPKKTKIILEDEIDFNIDELRFLNNKKRRK